jgi:DNA-binding CsgD family transcriptional regulator
MVRSAELIRTASRVFNYIEKYVTKVGAEKREEVLAMFDTMHMVFPHWTIMTCPMMHPDLHYASKNCSQVFGYDTEYIVRNSSMDKYFAHVHEADQKDLFDCFSFVHDTLEEIDPREHHEYRYIFHYRFRTAGAKFIHLHDEKATISLRNSGNLYYALFRDVTEEKPYTGVKVELFRQRDTLIKVKECKPSFERRSLSNREKDLVTLIGQGLSTKEIAWQLKISHNTVRNIKSRLFEKFNVNNSIELLNMAGK